MKIVAQLCVGCLTSREGNKKKRINNYSTKNTLVINQNKLRKIVVKRLKALFIVQGFAMNLYPDGKCKRVTRERGNGGRHSNKP